MITRDTCVREYEHELCVEFQFQGPLTISVKGLMKFLLVGISRILSDAQAFPVCYSDEDRNHADSLVNDINNFGLHDL